jgi:hypothetical protein
MKSTLKILSLTLLAASVVACSYRDQRTLATPSPTVVEHRTTVVEPVPTAPSTVNCANGYDAATNTCY